MGKVHTAQTKQRQTTPGPFVVATSFTDELVRKGISRAELFRIVVPRRTLARRNEQGGMLSPEESDRALRLDRIIEQASRVFGSPQTARRWLRKPCRALGGAVPIDLMASETGAHMVEEELHAIDYGVYA
ncbi:MAG: hypothetical protein BroJett030_30450 [Alphaproteobacteria bacterium]|nr:MAG: hypothetical protein BroJett030_30450 [Alphaproteobacteria bacterium]